MWMTFRSMELGLLSVVVALAFGAGPAQATPQSLALVATNGTVDLTCQDGECGAEFSTFCLQMDRFSPVPGTEYRLAGGGDVRLIGTTKDGRQVALDARRYLRFESLRTHLALRISVGRQELDRLGLKTVAVAVGENVALLPADADQDTQAELAVLEHALRPLGSLIVDQNRTRMTAARIANRMINRLPATGQVGADTGKAAWRRAIAEAGIEGPADQGLEFARKAFNFCQFAASRSRINTLRICLQGEHDRFVNFLNSSYWKAVKTGS